VRIPFLATAAGTVHHLEVRLTRARLEAMIADLVDATVQACRRALGDAKLRPHDVSDVLLVGGSSRIPAVRRAIEGFIGREPRDAIAPDEIVAMGAAVQGGILVGAIRNLDFQDVLPLSLGIQTAHGSFTRVIPRNTPIPASVTRTFSTARDDQASVGLHVLQGERAEAAGNASLGQFSLKDLPPMPRGTPRVEVTFDVDADGILHVSAREGVTGKGKRVVVKSRTGLSDEELNKLLAEADRHRQQDEIAEKLAEKRNLLDGLIVEIERALKADGLSPDRADVLKALLARGSDAMDSADGAALEAASEEILQAFRMRRDE
jgi:molecular chaperone DnaK